MPSFGDYTVNVAERIRDILDEYPAGSAIFREILQNTDDAGGQIQKFILDTRPQPRSDLFNSALEACQGPSIIAYNNAKFSDKDWESITHISYSSKKNDDRSTGKYGLGFCTVYHVTDNPQILSDERLLVLDPHKRINESSSLFSLSTVRNSNDCDRTNYPSHFSPFDAVFKTEDERLNGTAIRLPLRSKNSQSIIKSIPTSVADVEHMLEIFISNDLPEIMLFLKSISTIEISKVTKEGTTVLATAQIENLEEIRALRRKDRGRESGKHQYELRISIKTPSGKDSARTWIVTHFTDDSRLTCDTLAQRLRQEGTIVQNLMKEDKLFPHVALAFPIVDNAVPATGFKGRLFTLLPLPIFTGFPLHIHAVLALTSSRQNLRNAQEAVTDLKASLRVEWNRAVFSEVVPKAWLSLLGYIVERGLNVFDAWPDAVASRDGDHGYWHSLPRGLLAKAAYSAVWPLNEDGSQRKRLVEVLVASDEDEAIPVLALHACRVPLALVPSRLLNIIKSSEFAARVLTPRTAGPLILKHVKVLSALRDPATKTSLCDYLLSTGDIAAIFGLPLLPTVQGEFIALTPKLPHIMATAKDADVFRDVAPKLLAADSMSPGTRQLLEKSGRIRFIGPAEVGDYLRTKLRVYEGQRTATVTNDVSSNDVPWLLRFWAWLDHWDQLDTLVSSEVWSLIQKLHALPLHTTNDRSSLRLVERGALRPAGISRQVLAAMNLLEIPVLHLSMSSGPAVQRACKLVSEITFILQNIGNIRAAARMQPGNRESLHHFLVTQLSHLQSSFPSNGKSTLEPHLKTSLRDLPIFPILEPGTRNERGFSFGPAPRGMRFVNDSVQVIPVIRETAFVLYSQAKALSMALEDNDVADEIAILKMVINPAVWRQQPPELRPLLVDRIIRRLSDFDQDTRTRIASLDIIVVGDSNIRKSPKFVIDPSSDIADLYDQDDRVLPVGEFPQEYIQQLRAHNMLQSSLTDHAVVDRIRKITNLGNQLDGDNRMKLALRLLELIDHHAVQTKGKLFPKAVDALRGEAWLPLDGNLHQPSECWDSRPADTLLCDMVLTIFPIELRSEDLRNLLGWNTVPFHILRSQLLTITEPNRDADADADTEADAGVDADADGLSVTELSKRVKEILKALASCYQNDECTEDDITQLAETLGGVEWVPVFGSRLRLAQRSTLEPTELSPRFSQVSSSLLAARGVKTLLKSMGVTERPCVTELQVALHGIADELSQESEVESRSRIILDSIRIAEEICGNSDEKLDGWTLLVPTARGELADSRVVIFNDAGLDFPQLDEGLYFSHELMSAASAKALGLQSYRALQLDQLGDEAYAFYLGEDITTRIRGVLADYDINYSINEWIANAHDAGASCLKLLLDKAGFEGPPMLGDEVDFKVSPALIVHNDAIFQEEDFQGIGSIGKGGKGEKSNTIGRFGLGALTFYHFTELPMVVSGDTVVFLDPSRRYMSLNKNGGGVRMSLQQCFVFYPELLKPLEGVFEFSTKSDYYDGTLFRFPLRTKSQASKSEISRKEVTSGMVAALLEDFYEHSRYSLLFTSLHEISAHQRSHPETNPSEIWSITAYPTKENRDNDNGDSFVTTVIEVETEAQNGGASQQQWLVSRSSAFHDLIESWNIDSSLVERYRLANRTLDCGLAFDLSSSEFINTSKLFATLPLPVPISLPVHVHATWILAQDRRSIRADASIQGTDPPPDAEFNRYIMQNSIPHLYLKSLAFINEHYPKAMHLFWPKRLGSDTDETVSNALYRQLPISEYQVLRTWEDMPISAKDAVIHLQTTPESVRTLLVALKLPRYVPYPHLDTSFFEGSNQVQHDSPSFVASILRNNLSQIHKLYRGDNPAITLEDIEDILWYLIEGEINLLKIPLLPLHDGSIVQFAEGPIVFASHQHQLSRLFDSNHIISSEITADLTEALTDQGINVRLTDAAGIRELLKIKGVVVTPKMRISESDAEWHKELLNLLTDPDPPATLDELSDLPLIPTASKDSTVSLRYARGGSVWCRSPWEEPRLKPTLLELQIPVVDLSDLPEGLLQANEANLRNVLTVLARFGEPISEVNTRVSLANWKKFASLVKGWITSENLQNLLLSPEACQTLCQLPLFNGQQGHTTMDFLPALSLTMLPASVSNPTTITKYLPRGSIFAPFSKELLLVLQQFLPDQIVSIQNVIKQLHIHQNQLPTGQEGEFRLVLSLLTEYHRGKYRNPLIPDVNRHLRRPEDMYDDRVELFSKIFQNRRHLLVHPDYRDSMDDWIRLGLRHEVDETSLLACIKAVDEDTRNGANTRLRATWLWNYLNQGPPGLWKLSYDAIRKLRFIPRSAQRHPSETPSNSSIRNLQMVVSPDDLSLSEYSSISWSQLGSFERPPDRPIQNLYPEIGIPSVEHVVQHLVVLATNIAPTHGQSPWLVKSIKEVYDWLQNNKEKAQKPLAALSAKPIWLNADEVESGTGTWCAASQLKFELGYDRPDVYDAKRFLHQYRGLLLAAGASEHSLPEVEALEVEITPHSERVWSAFIKLLEDDQLVDIRFTPEGAEKPIFAHKLVLAAAIPYFIPEFTSGPRDSVGSGSSASYMEYELPPDTKASSVRAVIDFAYKGAFSTPVSVTQDNAEQTLKDLFDLLRLCDRWKISKLKRQGEEAIMRLKLVNEYNWSTVLARAQEWHAEKLQKYCLKARNMNEWRVIDENQG
ncbi:hypothetical protein FRC00_002981 [Tulasnella sp. 408]|nr:hypothetical protein FRC00_002981 [Tulasnella sp. 408]